MVFQAQPSPSDGSLGKGEAYAQVVFYLFFKKSVIRLSNNIMTNDREKKIILEPYFFYRCNIVADALSVFLGI